MSLVISGKLVDDDKRYQIKDVAKAIELVSDEEA